VVLPGPPFEKRLGNRGRNENKKHVTLLKLKSAYFHRGLKHLDPNLACRDLQMLSSIFPRISSLNALGIKDYNQSILALL